MREENIENSSCNTIKVLKIIGEEVEEDESFRAKAILSMKGDLINTLSKRLKVFLQENKLSGGIMDINMDTYEFELILTKHRKEKEKESKTIASYMIDFIDFINEDFQLEINNNFDGLEVTAEELDKLLQNTSV